MTSNVQNISYHVSLTSLKAYCDTLLDNHMPFFLYKHFINESMDDGFHEMLVFAVVITY